MYKVRTRTIATITLLSLCIVVTGCATTSTLPRPQTAPEAQAAGLKPGDKVIVQLRSGEIRTFRVTAIEADALVGKAERIAYADIEKLQRRNVSAGRTAGLVGGVLAVLGGAFVYVVVQAAKNSD